MTALKTAITLLILVSHAFAHMEISSPPPLRSKYNPNTNKDDIDYSMTSPLSNTGGGFPCKGYLSLLGTSQGKSVASWAAGSSQSFSVVGSATHGGGSCQTSLSLDSGKTFRVIHSYTGGCPLSPSYNFKVPADTPATQDAIFAWTWHNEIGDREMYMNCAVVNILPPGNTNNKREQVSFSSRPAMFEANIGNGCSTVEMFDVLYPNPGPDVTNGGSKTKSPIGSCGSLSSVGASGSYESSESNPDDSSTSVGTSDTSYTSISTRTPISETTKGPNAVTTTGPNSSAWTPGNDFPESSTSAASSFSVGMMVAVDYITATFIAMSICFLAV